ncbi:hypothetical protein LKI01_15720 [Companilactobacillus paralimentarius]|uniref:Uncharacterized protein n=1 Tax=Companilactobacillus kimchii DSM 13961 = JCM 10707 TaxID=1423765 RepID=A0ABR5NRN0_9LACO|nr:hypothetical protein FC97_GL001310 [Companilactobacillus kimchii DSM 13961 = JCM 10707]GEO47573.1 hypothetical protein LKI01_15720 [Companilactobacillus paralimentarius]
MGAVVISVVLLLVKVDPDTGVLASVVDVAGLFTVVSFPIVGVTVEIVVDFGVTKVALTGFIPEVVGLATVTRLVLEAVVLTGSVTEVILLDVVLELPVVEALSSVASAFTVWFDNDAKITAENNEAPKYTHFLFNNISSSLFSIFHDRY